MKRYESVLKLSHALNISLSELFDKLDSTSSNNEAGNNPETIHSTELENDTGNRANHSGFNYPLHCYDLILSKSLPDQKKVYEILISIEKYKGTMI